MKRPDHIPTVATLSRLKAGVYAHWRDRATSAVRVYVQKILTYVHTYVCRYTYVWCYWVLRLLRIVKEFKVSRTGLSASLEVVSLLVIVSLSPKRVWMT